MKAKTYTCKICGMEVRQSAIPKIIAKERECPDCYQTRIKAFGETFMKPKEEK